MGWGGGLGSGCCGRGSGMLMEFGRGWGARRVGGLDMRSVVMRERAASRASAAWGSVAVMVAGGVLMAAGVGGCRGVGSSRFVVSPADGEETLRADGVVLEAGGVRAEYSPGIDRLVEARVRGGVNTVEVRDLGMEPAGDGSYRFYGGLYSWVAPQGGEHGWVGEGGERSAWPPDPAMDVGPASVVGVGDSFVESVTPADRRGLRQRKRIEVVEGGAGAAGGLGVTYALDNTGEGSLFAGPWMNTAVSPGGVVAVKIHGTPLVGGEGVQPMDGEGGWSEGVRAWNDDPVGRFWSIAEGPLAGGWTFLWLDRVGWTGGTKFFIDGVSEIAVWTPGEGGREGAWLHRRVVGGLSDASREALIANGEAPVAVYIDMGSGVIEAELYGELGELGPGERVVMREAWRIVPSGEPSVLRLEEGAGVGVGER